MKRIVSLALVALGCLIGYALPHPAMLAQGPAAAPAPGQPRQVPIFTIDGSKYPRAQNGKGVIWTREELRQKYITDPKAPGSDHLLWAPPYRITIQRRQAPQNGGVINSELHDDKTQIYMIIGGSGTVLLGGKPDVDNSAGPGEHRGSPLVGAASYHVKEGDVIAIPPQTWHASAGDPGQPMTYLMVHVEDRQTIP
jgi:mannose-6-phosphate isomerase-like protein (cupin superfamily)